MFPDRSQELSCYCVNILNVRYSVSLKSLRTVLTTLPTPNVFRLIEKIVVHFGLESSFYLRHVSLRGGGGGGERREGVESGGFLTLYN